MWHRVKDLSPDQRIVLEGLIGRGLQEDEGLNIQPSRILQESLTGDDRAAAYSRYLGNLDQLAGRASGVADVELEAMIEEACRQARHPRSWC
jgi:hypothetical protein